MLLHREVSCNRLFNYTAKPVSTTPTRVRCFNALYFA